MIKAVIFDLDGVLADTEHSRFRELKKILQHRRITLHDDDYKKCVGRRTKVILTELFGDRLSESEMDEISLQWKEIYSQRPQTIIRSQPYAHECCKILHEAGYTLAIASSTGEGSIKIVLEMLQISTFFHIVVGSEFIKQNKPHPETYETCIGKLHFPKQQCIAIEDSPTGIRSAKGAGLTCIGITQTHHASELHEADKIVNSLQELTPVYLEKFK